MIQSTESAVQIAAIKMTHQSDVRERGLDLAFGSVSVAPASWALAGALSDILVLDFCSDDDVQTLVNSMMCSG